ncbi:hypothetical protein DMB65_17150 [Flavobacterium cheongpyeongense]|jgi:hypothetical protein|uniref:Lipocalin-like domain-containing protein n=1 Tax=Flavobacterium cheongpyeongense TaxID=2212651 RepID=A0A2V4BLA7_9FLAO|nr:hypothetical protein [Flavobacterium cheongpyeongense]PXY39547.1 hypothetical protein DMB65_17150 [Flavobacterium cheongpyeongense]
MLKKYSILFLLFFVAVSCKKASAPPPPQINSFYKKVITADDRKTITPEEAKTYHIDKTCLYQYRTGYSQHYEYNYDVKGTDVKGDSVFGNINVEGKYGAGILITDSVGDIEINTEWIAYGKLKAIDKKGNQYQLIVK